MVSVANPMIWPYFRIGAPGSMAARATLCPRAIASRTATVRPPTERTDPLGIGWAATATLSSLRNTIAPGAPAVAAIATPLRPRQVADAFPDTASLVPGCCDEKAE